MRSHQAFAAGGTLADIETPVLVIEVDALERNLARMARFASRAGIGLRAHAKTHKCPTLGRRQVELGSVGLCCQTVHEAEAMVAGGITDVLVSNEIVSPGKLQRLARLAHHARVAVCADDARNIVAIGAAAAAEGVRIDVLIEIDVGANRCGVAPGPPAVELARLVARTAGLNFRGLQAYHGSAQHYREHQQRLDAIARAIELCRQTRDLLVAAGLGCAEISGAGTGTFELEAASGVYTELQAGTYAFMDGDYSRNRTANGTPYAEFEQCLFVLATVISRPKPGIAVIDAGLKAIGVDAGLPIVADLDGALYTRASDEHGVLDISACQREVRSADRVRLTPGNCDPTVNLHDIYVVSRDGVVRDIWPITARGPGR
ncbi:MAG: DSD1 family PLP-dependent enzyme [Gammaproteobacteria bacterium]